jgi:RNA polymerase sigma factor (sigma-70 family)
MNYLPNELSDSPGEPAVAAAPRNHVAEIAPTDGERLMRFVRRRDEAAFRELVETHAPMVWGVCWQLLRHREDIEDAFQATFLILARKAPSILSHDSIAGWLYRVAFRTANLARQRRQRRGCEPIVEEPASLDEQLAAIERTEQCQVLLDELNSLAVRYREPIVLCYLEGCTRSQAADQLGVTAAAVKGLLARGLRLLRRRLAQRGAALSTAAAALAVELATAQAANDSLTIAQATAAGCGLTLATGTAVGVQGAATPGAVTLAQKGIMAMTLAAAAKPAISLLAVGMTAGALALATAAPPSDGGYAGTTIIELAATDAPASPAAETQFGLAATSADAPTTQLSVTSSAPVAENAVAAVGPAATPAGQPRAGSSDSVATTTPAPDPNASIAAGTVSVDGGTLKVTAPAGTLTLQPSANDPTGSSGTLTIGPPQTANAVLYASSYDAGAASTTTSRAALEIELQYWTLKASGLSKKAEALKLKAGSIDSSSDSERVLVLEIESEAELTLAEVKHCEAMAQQLKDDLARPDQPVPTYTAPVPGIPGAGAPAADPPAGAGPAIPAPGAYVPAQPYGARPPRVLTPQNSYVSPVNPPIGPGVTGYPTETTPALQMQYQTLSLQMAELQAQNERLQQRVDELEGEHEPAER